MAREYSIPFFETSAKQDMNVEKSFVTMATEVKNRLMLDGGSGSAPTGGHKLAPGAGAATSSKGGCCK